MEQLIVVLPVALFQWVVLWWGIERIVGVCGGIAAVIVGPIG
ncbi:MAG TPA: hypothetical protein VM285_15225 [Polyangia bacterium]|nr:hypothetical protein [Polyangia bacterium]